MADEHPKDYSSVYCEPPVPPMRNCNTHNNNQQQQQQQQIKQTVWSDGAKSHKRQCESTVDLRAVVSKLQNLPRAYAIDTLNKHYSSVFDRAGFKAYIQYCNEKETYVVRVDRNTLKDVRDKLPKRGNYRYFFKQLDDTYEEVELDESIVPFHERGRSKQIYCQVFPF